MIKTIYERSLCCVIPTTDAYCCQCGKCGREFLSVLVKDVEPTRNGTNAILTATSRGLEKKKCGSD